VVFQDDLFPLGPEGNFSGEIPRCLNLRFPGHERPGDQAFRFTKERGSLPFCCLARCYWMLASGDGDGKPIPDWMGTGIFYIYHKKSNKKSM